jgi:hypothetical protein
MDIFFLVQYVDLVPKVCLRLSITLYMYIYETKACFSVVRYVIVMYC